MHLSCCQGNTGVLLGMLLVSLVVLVALVTVMSGIGVCERCRVGGGGVYSMISTVLGRRVGGTVGLLYVFGQVRVLKFSLLLNTSVDIHHIHSLNVSCDLIRRCFKGEIGCGSIDGLVELGH